MEHVADFEGKAGCHPLIVNIGLAYSLSWCTTAAQQVQRVSIDEETTSLLQKDNTLKSIWHADMLNIGFHKRATQIFQTVSRDYVTFYTQKMRLLCHV